nr:glycosyltransferase family 2 protein [Pseudoclavibacter soli]
MMPAYNEESGIVEFLDELLVTSPLTAADSLRIIVVDDHSTDAMPEVLDAYAADHPDVGVLHSSNNQGHGPTALRAYREGLASEPDWLVFVDGDGQFTGVDVWRTVRAAVSLGADVIHGVRTHRDEPWYRRMLTSALGSVVAVVAGGRVPDVNTPLRVYRPPLARALIDLVPETALVPHVHFSIAEQRAHLRRGALAVRSIPRRGGVSQGSTWGGQRVPLLPPKRLRTFVRNAIAEVWCVSLRPGSTRRTRHALRNTPSGGKASKREFA